MSVLSPLQQQATRFGIALGYTDNANQYREASDDELHALLAAVNAPSLTSSVNVSPDSDDGTFAKFLVFELGSHSFIEFSSLPPGGWDWKMSCVGGPALGESTEGSAARRIPAPANMGYYELVFQQADEQLRLTLIVVPEKAYSNDECEKPLSVSVQLYSLRSGRNRGIGDFGDLKILCSEMAKAGVDAIGLNPLHALYRQHPLRCSPYSPSSRCFFNPIYLELEAVPGFDRIDAVCSRNDGQALIDYRRVSDDKTALMRKSHLAFKKLIDTEPSLYAQYQQFLSDGGEALELHARFEAFDAWFSESGRGVTWRQWPSEFQNPRSHESEALARQLADEIDFACYLQWLCVVQLTELQKHCKSCGMGIGLYLDLAVGVDINGAECWAHPHLFAHGVHIGAPPDALGPLGQDWSLAPYRPAQLQSSAYKPFVDMLRANMQFAGALRMDHVMGLMRQYWCIPDLTQTTKKAHGAYIAFPFQELLGIAVLESHLNQCELIGEDLGTVPAGVREELARRAVLGYRVLYFERDGSGDAYKCPADYPESALAVASTHDLPPLAGFWEHSDLEMRSQLGLVSSDQLQQQKAERERDKAALLRLLVRHAIVTEAEAKLLDSACFVSAVHKLLALAPSRMMMVQLEDMLCQTEMANLPGTIDEHPNWRRNLSRSLESLLEDTSLLSELTRLVKRRRQSKAPES